MPESVMYHEGNRKLQDQFDSRRISDRLEEKLTRKTFTAEDRLFIESMPYFFLATADARQIYVTKVDKGSPADGILAVGDVIPLTLVVESGGKRQSVEVKAEARAEKKAAQAAVIIQLGVARVSGGRDSLGGYQRGAVR